MIEASQLMLGDYFLVGKDNKKYMFVASVNNSCILFDYINNDGYLYESQKEYIEPIPITEDLLKRIGFDYVYNPCFLYKRLGELHVDLCKSERGYYTLRIYRNNRDSIMTATINCLHELQQAVRLVTKKELTIEL